MYAFLIESFSLVKMWPCYIILSKLNLFPSGNSFLLFYNHMNVLSCQCYSSLASLLISSWDCQLLIYC